MIRSKKDLKEAANKAIAGDRDETEELASFALYHALDSDAQEVLFQLVKNGPVWDGDLISKAGRNELLTNGLATKCCAKGEQGYQVANYVGWNVLMSGTMGQAKSDLAATPVSQAS